jgi:hypothetical protein
MIKHIKYGEWECMSLPLAGLESPIVKELLDRIKELDWTDYELWTHGSILGDTTANDIDLTIIGPHDVQRVSKLLEDCVRLGYQRNIQTDVKYLVEGHLYDAVEGHPQCNIEAHYQPEIWINGTTYKYGVLVDGLWCTERHWPMVKSAPYSPKQLI